MLFAVVKTLLERIGITRTPTERSAKDRLDRFLKGKTVLSRGRGNSTGEGKRAFTAQVAEYPETIRSLSSEELAAVKENAALVDAFLERYATYRGGPWSLSTLDAAFGQWVTIGLKSPYTDEAVIQIAGAAFGEYCAEHLSMEWVVVEGNDGRALGIAGAQGLVKGFPYSTVSKRIPLREYGFFTPVFEELKAHVDARARNPGA